MTNSNYTNYDECADDDRYTDAATRTPTLLFIEPLWVQAPPWGHPLGDSGAWMSRNPGRRFWARVVTSTDLQALDLTPGFAS